MSIPVLFFQVTRPNTVAIAINRAAESGNDVVLVGDRDYSKSKCHFFNCSRLMLKMDEWISAHTSGRIYDLNKLCIYRWVCILEAFKSIPLTEAWCCDSDVLVFQKTEEMRSIFPDVEATLSFCPELKRVGQFSCHAGHSYMTRKPLEVFSLMVHRCSDMNSWSELSMIKNFTFADSASPNSGKVLDHHLGNDLGNYTNGKFGKRVSFDGGLPFVHHTTLGPLMTPVLHCWNDNETRMDSLSKCIPS